MTRLRAVDTPKPVPATPDGDSDEMFPLLSAADVAQLTGVKPAHIRYLWRTGELPYVQMGRTDEGPRAGGTRRMRSDHLRAFVEGRTVT